MAKVLTKQKQQIAINIEQKIKEVNKKYWQKYYAKIQKLETKAEWKELALLLQQIRELHKQVENIESDLKSKLQTIFENENKEVLEDDDIKVTGKWQKRSVLDVKKLKEELPDIYEQFKTESLSFVIRIKKNNKEV